MTLDRDIRDLGQRSLMGQAGQRGRNAILISQSIQVSDISVNHES